MNENTLRPNGSHNNVKSVKSIKKENSNTGFEGDDEDSVTRQKTALFLKQKHPGLFIQSASGSDGRVSRTRTGRKTHRLLRVCSRLAASFR